MTANKVITSRGENEGYELWTHAHFFVISSILFWNFFPTFQHLFQLIRNLLPLRFGFPANFLSIFAVCCFSRASLNFSELRICILVSGLVLFHWHWPITCWVVSSFLPHFVPSWPAFSFEVAQSSKLQPKNSKNTWQTLTDFVGWGGVCRNSDLFSRYSPWLMPFTAESYVCQCFAKIELWQK